jgi:holo-[acyl-carrier protein] synthase
MIIGTGIDLVDIARIEQIWQKFGQTFAKRLLHPDELAELPTEVKLQGRWLAKRWAVKEAFRNGISWWYHHDAICGHS